MCGCEIRSLGASYRRVPRRSWCDATFHHELLRPGDRRFSVLDRDRESHVTFRGQCQKRLSMSAACETTEPGRPSESCDSFSGQTTKASSGSARLHRQ